MPAPGGSSPRLLWRSLHRSSWRTALTEPAMDELDRIVNETFAGRVVRKDLVRQVKVGSNVPVYVLEFLLGKYCASDDPVAIAAGLEVVNQTLRENFIRPDESELAMARIKQRGQYRLIDKVDVRLVASEDKFWAHLQNFNDKYVHIPEELVYKYDRLLQGGAWCQLDLLYNVADDEAQKRPFYIKGLKPIQVAAFDLDEYLKGRQQLSRDAWLDLVMRTIGLEPDKYDLRGKLLSVLRLVPMAERNYNLIELGPWGTGKSFVYRESNPNSILISGGKVTVAQLFVNMSTGRVGLLGTWDVVTFDEVAGLQMSESAVINMLKDYMESGSFARGKEEVPAEASVVLVGNTSKPHTELVRTAHLFADLPPAMVDPAFLDRLHYYLPGWEAPKLETRLFTNHFGIETDYKTLGKKQDKDGFALWLNGLLDNLLGPTAAAGVSLNFEELDGHVICRVDVKPGSDPTFVSGSKGEADLYVRLSNATRLLNTAEALEYLRTHWR